MISGMTADGTDEWGSGKIYNAENGKTYRSKMALKNADTLEVSGCVFILCEDQTWTRVK